jgi:hypothetical protein
MFSITNLSSVPITALIIQCDRKTPAGIGGGYSVTYLDSVMDPVFVPPERMGEIPIPSRVKLLAAVSKELIPRL